MKKPSEIIQELIIENLDKLQENQRHNFSNIDKFMIWVVGFSIGGISIIATNITQFNQLFSHLIIKITLILLVISVISGLVYRWFFYLFQAQYQNGEMYLKEAFSNKEIMELEEDAIDDEQDILEIIRRLRTDFGEEVSHMQEVYSNSNDNIKGLIVIDLKNHYRRLAKWAKADYELGIKHIKETFKEAFGYSEKKIEKFFNNSTGRNIQFYGRIVNVAFYTSCLSFISVLIILCIKY